MEYFEAICRTSLRRSSVRCGRISEVVSLVQEGGVRKGLMMLSDFRVM